MDILFANSDDLVITLLTKWLDLCSVVRLDTACASSNSSKENLRRLLASKESVFPNDTDLCIKFNNNTKYKLVQWLLLRNVKVADLVVTSELIANSTMMKQYFVLCGSGLQSLNINGYNRTLVSFALAHCPRLETLYMDDWGEQSCLLLSESVESLHLSASGTHYRKIHDNVVINFPRLKELTVYGSDLPKSVLANFIGNFTRLQRIVLEECYRNTNLDAIKPICQTLQHLTLKFAELSCSELGVMLHRMPQLTELVLSMVFDNDRQVYLRATEAFEIVACNCPALTVFHFICDEEEEQDSVVGAFTSMLNKCPHLREICVCGEFVSDALLHTLASHRIASIITHLTVTECDISEVGLAEIAKKCSQLQFVEYSIGKYYRTTELCKGLFRQGVKVDVMDSEYSVADEGEESGEEEEEDEEEEVEGENE